MAKDLLNRIGKPLGGQFELPTPRDLGSFWKGVERAIEGLNAEVKLGDIKEKGCHNLAPIILGEAAYSVVEGLRFGNWEGFKLAINQHFGLTEE